MASLMQVQKVPPRELGGLASVVFRQAFRIASDGFIGALRKEALNQGVAVGGYDAICYWNGSNVLVIVDSAWSPSERVVAAVLEDSYAGILPTGWLLLIEFVIPQERDPDGTPVLDVVFSETYEVVSP